MNINDLKLSALATAVGTTGQTDDLELAWLQSLGATSVTVQDAWTERLVSLGYTAGALGDMQYQYFGDLGYTGSLQDRWFQFWDGDIGGGGGGAELQFLKVLPTYIQFTNTATSVWQDTGYVEVEFKTNEPRTTGFKSILTQQGAASNNRLYLQAGAADFIAVVHGAGTVTIPTGIDFWDGEWHKVRLEIRGTTLWMVIDDGAYETSITTSPMGFNSLGYSSTTDTNSTWACSFRNFKLVYNNNDAANTTQIDAPLNDDNGNLISNSGGFGDLTITGTENTNFQWVE